MFSKAILILLQERPFSKPVAQCGEDRLCKVWSLVLRKPEMEDDSLKWRRYSKKLTLFDGVDTRKPRYNQVLHYKLKKYHSCVMD